MLKGKKRRFLSLLLSVFLVITSLQMGIPDIQAAIQFTDPISSDMVQPGVITVDQAYAVTGSAITIIGQVTYIYGTNGTADTALIEDVIDGEIVGLQIYDKANITSYTIGDVIEVTGTLSDYGNVRQLSKITNRISKGNKPVIPAQEHTIAELLAGGDSFLSEYVLIKDVTLGSKDASGNTPLQDSTSKVNLFKGASYPTGIAEGSVVDITAAFSKYYSSYQLRTGSSTDYTNSTVITPTPDPTVTVTPIVTVAPTPDPSTGSDTVDTSIVLPIASWAGTGNITSPTVYADLEAPNDFLDTSACITHSSGVIPVKVTASGSYLCTTGSMKDSYYLIHLSSALYGNLNLSYKMRGSNTGPKNFQILYSVDGSSFTPVDSSIYSITSASTTQAFSLALPAAANRASDLYIKLLVADNVSVNNGTIGSGGTNYLSDVLITGSPAVSKGIAVMPVISPSQTEVMQGQEITLTTATTGSAIYYQVNGGTTQLYDDANKPVISAFPYKIIAYASKEGILDSIKLRKTYTQLQVLPVEASKNGGSVYKGTTITLSCPTEDAHITFSTDGGQTWVDYTASGIKLNELPATIKAKATKTGCMDSSISTFTFSLKENADYNIYFGQIHSHTEYSDGAGTCAEAFTYAKNEAKQIDFLAVTDHSNSFDNEASASILDGSMSTEWVEGHNLADQYTDSTFVGIYGYEMTWSNNLGHINTFNTAGFQSRNQAAYGSYSTALQNYYATLKTDMNSISMFNHPGTTFGDFEDFDHYDETIDQLISLVEVGNGEGAVGSSGYFASYDYYTRALDKGWHLAPANNQDNHKGKWGDANTARTVVLADTLTRENIYDALRNMRTYATEDNDLEIRYTLNNEIMGTSLDTTPSEVAIKVALKDPTDAAIGKVEVIVNGGLSVASQNVTTGEETVTFDLAPDYSYYYIRVTQTDSDIAVTAPVWIGDVEAAGIASISTTQQLQVKGEPLTIDTKLYNNEDVDLTIESMEFSVNGSVIHTADLAAAGITSVSKGNTAAYSFLYASLTAGAADINVTVHATLGSVAKVYKSVLKLNFSDPAMVTKVVIDGSHFNDYVTGYYAGNMGNFTKIAAAKNTAVTVVNDKLTEEILSDCDLLIISAPAKKSGSTSLGSYIPSHFEEDFISLVKAYTDRGGDLILCGLADYQDTADVQSTTEINKLLTALKATTRINSDEAYDTENNGGQPYRLYLTDYNKSSVYLNGIVDGQRYSSYSGCTILLDPDAVAAGTAEYLVKGHPTTYSIDSKTFGGNYKEIAMGDAVILAHETLPTGSNVFVASAVLMSNFEVQATLDNASDLAYSNCTIMENILDSVKKQMNVSEVSTIRSGVKGNIYCAEGTVTSGTVAGNAFFDTIYIQDATGGINIFPVNQGTIQVGQQVRVIGYLDEYLGDLELNVVELTVLTTTTNPVSPTEVTTKEAADYTLNGGKLVKIQGQITSVIMNSGTVEAIYVKDSSDVEARVFIDGYIGYSSSGSPLEDFVTIGNTISAVGLVSYDTEGERIRVRDRSEILFISTPTPSPTPTDTPTPTPTDTPTPSATPTPTVTPSPTPSATPTPTATPSPTPSATPTPTPTQEPNKAEVKTPEATPIPLPILVKVELPSSDGLPPATISASKMNGTIASEITIAADKLLKLAKEKGSADKPLELTIPISNDKLVQQFHKDDVNTLNISITLTDDLFDNENLKISNIVMPAELLKAAREEGKDISVSVKDGEGRERYSWSFTGEALANSDTKITDVNLSISLRPVDSDALFTAAEVLPTDVDGSPVDQGKNVTGLLIDFGHEGVLPAQATLRIYVGDLISLGSGKGLDYNHKIYLYHVNPETEKLETLPYSSAYEVDKDGYITIKILHCSDYVVLPKAADRSRITTLLQQITIAKATINLSVKGTHKIRISLPVTLQLVEKLTDKTTGSAVGAVTASYESSNKKVATVDQNGQIKAIAKGKATITVTVVLYSYKLETFTINVAVK